MQINRKTGNKTSEIFFPESLIQAFAWYSFHNRIIKLWDQKQQKKEEERPREILNRLDQRTKKRICSCTTRLRFRRRSSLWSLQNEFRSEIKKPYKTSNRV